ncbi:MAG TPA: histidine kinase [Chitinophagaceae bacterium]|nr:histidine kinase [Chitinophagaceae bacterium]
MSKSIFVSAIWLLPALLIVIESLIFLPKTLRSNSFITYFIVFWSTRAVLAPLIIFYTLKTWVDYNRAIRFLFVQLLGFFLFSVLFWFITYFFLQDTLYQNGLFGLDKDGTRLAVFALIVDNSLSINIVVYVSTVAFCYIWEFFRRNTEANQKAAALERSLLTSRLELLKGQLNTHFLFNTLHTISSLVIRNKGEEANNILLKLGELLRFALKDNKEQLIPLEKEIEILQLYLDIQQTRFNNRLDINIHYDAALNDVLVPPLLFQPLVENAIKYAVEPFKETGKIGIAVKKINDMISVTIADNGQTPFETINFNTGIGLQNTKERLEQLFGKNQSLSIQPNQPAGTMIDVFLPLQFYAK